MARRLPIKKLELFEDATVVLADRDTLQNVSVAIEKAKVDGDID